MSEQWVNLAYIENNETTSVSKRVIAPLGLLRAWANNNPFVTLYPHQIVVSFPPRCYGETFQVAKKAEE